MGSKKHYLTARKTSVRLIKMELRQAGSNSFAVQILACNLFERSELILSKISCFPSIASDIYRRIFCFAFDLLVESRVRELLRFGLQSLNRSAINISTELGAWKGCISSRTIALKSSNWSNRRWTPRPMCWFLRGRMRPAFTWFWTFLETRYDSCSLHSGQSLSVISANVYDSFFAHFVIL